MAGLFPEWVNRLVLIDCIPPYVLNQVRNDSFKALVAIQRLPFLLSLVFAGRNRGSVRRALAECVTDRDLITSDVVDRQYRLSRIKGTNWCLRSTFRNAGMALHLKEALLRIRQPTLMIWGEEDLIFPPAVGEELRRMIPGSTLHVLGKSGHIPMWEKPESVNPLILTFLKGSA
jgi:pimeloyl-ACP methyl ester carboxylesterase